uniref:Putative ovule protein n=1 Tax=Solanum chacoense TaxID=4108 RepID=A0A0V0GS48_SOLCH
MKEFQESGTACNFYFKAIFKRYPCPHIQVVKGKECFTNLGAFTDYQGNLASCQRQGMIYKSGKFMLQMNPAET